MKRPIIKPTIIVDLLPTNSRSVPFDKKVQELSLSDRLQKKVSASTPRPEDYDSLAGDSSILTKLDEKELAAEMLIYRHKFTELTLQDRQFRQAALTIIQNIYLFQNRKIFFCSTKDTVEQERQEALLIFTMDGSNSSLPLINTFQHLILARVWNRIISMPKQQQNSNRKFSELHSVVEKLNTLRNIYMILSQRLVGKLVKNISAVYRQSVTYEDAVQIGSFGIARAAYRYHPSIGIRFSTYASNWIFKEIQRQALKGRLIKVSSHTIERFAKAAREKNEDTIREITAEIASRTAILPEEEAFTFNDRNEPRSKNSPATRIEKRELKTTLLQAIELNLSTKSGDILKRKYGLPPYGDAEQSVVEISSFYGVTRGSIYQLEKSAIKKLAKCLS